MGEPLKNKTQSHCHRRDLTDRHDVHDDVDIKSAVEWLKETYHVNLDVPEIPLSLKRWILDKIDETFEDVIK